MKQNQNIKFDKCFVKCLISLAEALGDVIMLNVSLETGGGGGG